VRSPVGVAFTSETEPEELRGAVQAAEDLGFSEVWLPEDYFFSGGMVAATAALSATSEVRVGLGIVSAMVRHPGLLAMELATLSRLYPGRLLPGIGLGVPYWLGQMGLKPKSSLTAMRECVTSTRRLLDGEMITEDGDLFHFENVQLTHAARETLPIYMGVVGPKMLQLSGEIADGTVVGVTSSTEYLRWAREQINAGAQRAGRDASQHKIASYAIFSMDDDSKAAKRAARQQVAFYLGVMGVCGYTDAFGTSDEVRALIDKHGVDGLEPHVPDEWIDGLAIAGNPDECAEGIQRFLDAGADTVSLWLQGGPDAKRLLEQVSRDVLPSVSAAPAAG
jgi:alkanesulfonate monooxygenase SsuD/methylene tetrahydromethanopterin reductase-like flavin-dependent oxidoreductase (luciferase family)